MITEHYEVTISAGVQIRAKYFGELDGVKFIDNFSMFGYYNALSKQILAEEGAIEGVNVRAAPFDFRYAPPSKKSEQYFIKWEDWYICHKFLKLLQRAQKLSLYPFLNWQTLLKSSSTGLPWPVKSNDKNIIYPNPPPG